MKLVIFEAKNRPEPRIVLPARTTRVQAQPSLHFAVFARGPTCSNSVAKNAKLTKSQHERADSVVTSSGNSSKVLFCLSGTLGSATGIWLLVTPSR